MFITLCHAICLVLCQARLGLSSPRARRTALPSLREGEPAWKGNLIPRSIRLPVCRTSMKYYSTRFGPEFECYMMNLMLHASSLQLLMLFPTVNLCPTVCPCDGHRYLNRVGKHPALRKDEYFRDFLEDPHDVITHPSSLIPRPGCRVLGMSPLPFFHGLCLLV